MTMSVDIHRPASITADTSACGHSWLTIKDKAGNSVAVHVDRHIAVAMADAFNDEQEKLRTYSREELIAEDL